MRGNNQSISVLMRDGTARRMPRSQAEEFLTNGQAKHYISKTVYRAMKLGIEVKNPKARDADGKLRSQIKSAQQKAEAARHKAEEKRKKKAADRAQQEAAQIALNDD